MKSTRRNPRLPMFQASLAATVKVLLETPEDDNAVEMFGTVIKIEKSESSLLSVFVVLLDNGVMMKMNHDFFNATVSVIKGFERRKAAA